MNWKQSSYKKAMSTQRTPASSGRWWTRQWISLTSRLTTSTTSKMRYRWRLTRGRCGWRRVQNFRPISRRERKYCQNSKRESKQYYLLIFYFIDLFFPSYFKYFSHQIVKYFYDVFIKYNKVIYNYEFKNNLTPHKSFFSVLFKF